MEQDDVRTPPPLRRCGARPGAQLRQTNVDVLTEQLRNNEGSSCSAEGEPHRRGPSRSQAQPDHQLYAAEANLKTSCATYEQVIGDFSSMRGYRRPSSIPLPSQLEDAMTLGRCQILFVTAAAHQEEVFLAERRRDRRLSWSPEVMSMLIFRNASGGARSAGAAGLYCHRP